MSAAVVAFPAESQTLQFMNENGVVNIYMIMMSYLFAPNNDAETRYTFDGKELVRSTTSSSGGSNSQEKPAEIQLADVMAAVPNESPPELPDHQMMTSIEMSDSD